VREQKSPRVESFHWRAGSPRTSSVAMVLALCSFLVLHGIASAAAADKNAGSNAAAADKKAGSIEIKAHYETTPDNSDLMPPCSAITSVPSKGTCRGLARSTGPMRLTGDWQGQSEYTYGFFILPSAHTYGGGVDQFTGTIRGCGTGSVVYQQQFSFDSKGNFQGRWQMIEGSGIGGLAGLRGTGSYSADIKPDRSISGDYSGTVHCSK